MSILFYNSLQLPAMGSYRHLMKPMCTMDKTLYIVASDTVGVLDSTTVTQPFDDYYMKMLILFHNSLQQVLTSD